MSFIPLFSNLPKKNFLTAKYIRSASNISVHESSKERMKKTIIGSLDSAKSWKVEFSFYRKLRDIAFYVGRTADLLKFDRSSKAFIKERILEKLELPEFVGKMRWTRIFYSPRILAGIVLSAFVLAILFPFSFSTQLTYAAKFNYLKVEAGKVQVTRGISVFYPKSIFILKEGDTVATGTDGLAEIRFANDSIARLSADTELGVKKLVSKTNSVNMPIAVTLNKGRIWSKIVSFLSSSNPLVVSSGNTVVTASKKATFDLAVKEDTVTVSSVENAVDVHVVSPANTIVKKTVLEGWKVEISKNSDLKSKKSNAVIEVVKSNPEQENSEQWIKSNLKKDTLYAASLEKQIKGDVKHIAGILPDDPLYTVKTIAQNAKAGLTFNDIQKAEIEADLLMKKLLERTALLIEGKNNAAQELIAEFKENLNLLVQNLQTYPMDSNSALIKDRILAKIRELKVVFSPITPSSRLYSIKEELLALELFLEPNANLRDKVRLEQASSILFGFNDYIASGSSDSIRIYLYSYDSTIYQIIKNAKNNKDRNFYYVLMDTIISDLEILKSLEKKIGNSELRKLLAQVRANRLQDIAFLMRSANQSSRVQSLESARESSTEQDLLKILANLKDDLNTTLSARVDHISSLYNDDQLIELYKGDLTPLASIPILKNQSATDESDVDGINISDNSEPDRNQVEDQTDDGEDTTEFINEK